MGFRALVYGNIKGFLNHTPTPDEMQYWAEKSGISLSQVVSFTDGTKVQIEQALVANAFGATITRSGMEGIEADGLHEGGAALADLAQPGQPISDYLLAPKLPAGVFITAEHDESQRASLAYYKMGQGPAYTFLRPFHLCHLEIPKTIREVMSGSVLLNNGAQPTINVAAITKERVQAGTRIARGLGSFVVRGQTLKMAEHPRAMPIGLLQDATVQVDLEPGQIVTLDDVEIGDSAALRAWQWSVDRVA